MCVFYQTCDVLACSVSILHLMFISIGTKCKIDCKNVCYTTVLRALSGHQKAFTSADTRGEHCSVQGGLDLGPGTLPRLSHPRPGAPQHQERHAPARCVRDEQWTLLNIRVSSRIIIQYLLVLLHIKQYYDVHTNILWTDYLGHCSPSTFRW